jgi:hypothetical protein
MSSRQRDRVQLKMFILDVLRHDKTENLASIVKLLNNAGCIGWRNFWPDEFARDEVLLQLRALTTERQVEALQETDGSNEPVPIPPNPIVADDHIWFALTDAGWKTWSQWEAPASPNDPN